MRRFSTYFQQIKLQIWWITFESLLKWVFFIYQIKCCLKPKLTQSDIQNHLEFIWFKKLWIDSKKKKWSVEWIGPIDYYKLIKWYLITTKSFLLVVRSKFIISWYFLVSPLYCWLRLLIMMMSQWSEDDFGENVCDSSNFLSTLRPND